MGISRCNLPVPQQNRATLVIASASIVAKVWRDALIVRSPKMHSVCG